MRVVVTCGGTGGHITPALAIADLIRERVPRAEILFIGADGGMENELVKNAGYEIRSLAVRGLSRSLTLRNLKTLQMAHAAIMRAKEILKVFAPDIVIGTGGYACYPTLRAAITLGIPSAIHESNAVPGLVVKRLAARVDRVWLNFEQAAEGLPRGAKWRVVGNPLSRGYHTPIPAAHSQGSKKMILSFGGSLGAEKINKAILSLMDAQKEQGNIYHLHATGKRGFSKVEEEFRALGLCQYRNLLLLSYVSDMPRQMAAADLVICRAGAMSISELAALGKAAILIPSPNVTGDHQLKNAMALARVGAAVCLREEELSSLTRIVAELLADDARRAQMSREIRKFHKSEANTLIFEDIRLLCTKRGKEG